MPKRRKVYSMNLLLAFAAITIIYPILCWIMHVSYTANDEVEEVSSLISNGACSYLREQWLFLLKVVGIILIGELIYLNSIIGLPDSVILCASFGMGAFFTALAGDIAMRISTYYSSRVVYASCYNVNAGMKEAITAGALIGWYVSWSSLFLLCGLLFLISASHGGLYVILSFCLGASFISMLAKLAGGIFTKGADVGADLVGKLELGLSEDDRQNPAVIADNVGDNVGDCAGMAMDQFESRILSLSMVYCAMNDTSLLYAIFLMSVGLMNGLIGLYIIFRSNTKIVNPSDITDLMYQSLAISSIITVISAAIYCTYIDTMSFLVPTILGLILNFAMMFITERYTDARYINVQGIVDASKSGHGTNVIEGLAVGLKYTMYPIIAIAIVILLDTELFGLVAISMLSQSLIMITQDAFGPVADNAGGIAEMNHMEECRKTTDIYDAAGNSTKATTKGYSIATMLFTALLMLNVFKMVLSQCGVNTINLLSPYVIVGLLIGGMIMAVFAGLSLQAVRIAGSKVVDEIRQQTNGMIDGQFKPDYDRTITLLTKEAIRASLYPVSILMMCPVAFTLLNILTTHRYALSFLMGSLIGIMVVGTILSMFMMTSGGAWDNAKKYLEKIGHKGQADYAAAVTGDTVGDPCKDTAGPAIIPAIKFMLMFGIVMIVISMPLSLKSAFITIYLL